MSTPSTDPPANETPNKVAPETLALRASPRPVTRLNRRMLAIGTGMLGVVILGATLWSLQPRQRDPAAELYNVDRVTRVENLERLPKDYSMVPMAPKPVVPELGEPLPGDLGPAIVRARGNRSTGEHVSQVQASRMAQPGDSYEAARSGVFFHNGSAPSTAASVPVNAATMENASGNQPFNPWAPTLTVAQPIDPIAMQNRQDQKQAFLANASDGATRSPASLQRPVSPYQLMAGTVIPAALVTGINSDLPGQAIATVTEAVHDTATGRYLLIPQGSRLVGRYDSQVAFGQRRVLLIWTRLILPDTSSISLDKLPGIDPAGYAGLEDGVDWHWDRILAGAALSTLLGVGAELATPDNASNGDHVVIAARQSAQDTVNQVGQEITKRNLSIQPTLTIRPGFPMRVMVNKDLILRPYQPLFFERGSSQ